MEEKRKKTIMQNSVVHVYLFIIILDTTTACTKKITLYVLGIECHSSLGLKSRHHYCPQSNSHCSKQHFCVGKLVHTWKLLRFLWAKSQKSFQVVKFDFFGYGFRRENSKGQKVIFLSQCAIKALHASCGLFWQERSQK